jgi:hypothetical protein
MNCENSRVFEWHKWFKAGHKNMEIVERSRPRSRRTDENVERTRNLVHSDRRLSIDQAYYVEILKRLCEIVGRERHELWLNDCVLYYESAPVHKALSVKQFLA